MQVGKVERVTEKGNKVPIKNITIRDSTAQIKLTLWKDKTRIPIQPGDYIEATNIVLNSYLSNNTTWLSTIQVCTYPTVILHLCYFGKGSLLGWEV